jgi:hypothetical protein
MSDSKFACNIAKLLVAAGAAAVLGAAIFAPAPVRIADFSGLLAAGAGYFWHKLLS